MIGLIQLTDKKHQPDTHGKKDKIAHFRLPLPPILSQPIPRKQSINEHTPDRYRLRIDKIPSLSKKNEKKRLTQNADFDKLLSSSEAG